jgi:hypothetical protein
VVLPLGRSAGQSHGRSSRALTGGPNPGSGTAGGDHLRYPDTLAKRRVGIAIRIGYGDTPIHRYSSIHLRYSYLGSREVSVAVSSSMRISDGEAGGRAVREARRGGGPTSPASAPSTPPSSVGRSAVEDLPRRNLRRHRRRRPPSGASLGKEESAWEGRGIDGKQRCGMVPSVWSGDKVGPPSFFFSFFPSRLESWKIRRITK